MFQQRERFYNLALHAGQRIKHGYDLMDVIQDLQELEILVRTEQQAVELEILIEEASDNFGLAIEDYLHD